DPGADPDAPRGAAPRIRDVPALREPQRGAGAATVRAGAGALSRAHDGARARCGALLAPLASLHPRAPGRGSGPGPGHSAGAPRARRTRGAAVAPHAAERLRVPHPLSARRRRLPRAYPRLGEAAGRALRGLSSLARARLRKGPGECCYSSRMRTEHTIRPSEALQHVRYEIRGRLARRAHELERQGYEIISLNIGNPRAFGLRTPETMRLAMIESLADAEAYCPENAFVPDPEEVARLVSARTRAIVIINPNNPTGAVYPRAVLEALARLAEQRALVVFSDEIYDQMTYDGAEFVPMATLVRD